MRSPRATTLNETGVRKNGDFWSLRRNTNISKTVGDMAHICIRAADWYQVSTTLNDIELL